LTLTDMQKEKHMLSVLIEGIPWGFQETYDTPHLV